VAFSSQVIDAGNSALSAASGELESLARSVDSGRASERFALTIVYFPATFLHTRDSLQDESSSVREAIPMLFRRIRGRARSLLSAEADTADVRALAIWRKKVSP
jgi:hypothetical protein